MNKKLITVLFAIGLLFAFTSNSAAGWDNSGIKGNKNHHNIVNSGAVTNNTITNQGGTGGAGGIGYGGDGGSANVENDVDISTEQEQEIEVNVSNENIFPASRDITTNNVNAKGYRAFPESANIPIPGTPGYFGTAIPGSSFQSIKTGLMYKDVFSVGELEKMAKDATISGKWGSKVIITPLVDEVATEDKAEFVKVLLQKPGEDLEVTLLGYITVRATSKDTVSMEVLAEAALAARDLGADVIHVTAEGANRQLKAFGWGVGLSYTRASISDSETSGGISGGGTGISGGSSGYVDLPWFQIFALKVK